eukprot:gb/GFBE01078791.1/.p1 GENE.gb/GFBE01078791.1/~~gb/GFBE01078791.1/.p1  ORF type:complete len:493 (+),score=77.54 gb/GFBE01078791.1/:1-1479(+)
MQSSIFLPAPLNHAGNAPVPAASALGVVQPMLPEQGWRCCSTRAPVALAAASAAGCGALVVLQRRRGRSSKAKRHAGGHVHTSADDSGTGASATDARQTAGRPPPTRPLFLQLPLDNGVLLSGVLSDGSPKIHMLPPPTVLPPLAIVPVLDGGAAPCVPFDPETTGETLTQLRQRLSPGPLQPRSAAGKALRRALENSPENFAIFSDYELMRSALSNSQTELEEQAEALLIGLYARFSKQGGAPPRPAASAGRDYDMYLERFGNQAMKALSRTMSPDFCLIAKAHALGLAHSSPFPRLERKQARSLYSSAMRFGHALRQAEIRFEAEGAAGTFVPLPLEAELLREELEAAWAHPAVEGGMDAPEDDLEEESTSLARTDASDSEAAQRSLQEVLARLSRIGEAKPGLATYLGWLGKFDPEALSILSSPAPLLARAIRMQVDAVWGAAGKDALETVSATPADMLEAIVLGAWLRDAAAAAEEASGRHRNPSTEG